MEFREDGLVTLQRHSYWPLQQRFAVLVEHSLFCEGLSWKLDTGISIFVYLNGLDVILLKALVEQLCSDSLLEVIDEDGSEFWLGCLWLNAHFNNFINHYYKT
jgi:hypothetical protein